MSESHGRKRKKKGDDDEYNVEPTPARRKNPRKGKSAAEKKTRDITEIVEQIPLGSVPIIPLNSPQNPENIEEDDMKDCFDLLVKLMAMPMAEPFLEPVDYVTLELFQYPQMIKNPMDLGTVKQMLQHNCLENPGHFAEHVRLTFRNAIEFNLPGSNIYNDAEHLMQIFDEAFKQLCDKWNSEMESVDTKEDDKKDVDNEEKDKLEIEELQKNINSTKTAIANIKKQIDSFKKVKKKQCKLKSFKLTEPKTLFTFKEKEELCKLITDLDPDDLPELVSIIQSANPSYGNGSSDDGEFEIDIERIDDNTLFKVKEYVQKCAQDKSKRKGNRTNRHRRAHPEPVVDKEQIVLATNQTNQRLTEIKRQILDIKSQI